MPLLSICIPAYNRANLLPDLLDSIFKQNFNDFEIIVAEDNSPERFAIHSIVIEFSKLYKDKIKYYENPKTLGYDGNLRRLIELSSGEYVLFLGNDDLLADGALYSINNVIKETKNVGVILRSYASFLENSKNPVQYFHYFNDDRFFQPGPDTIITFFRRSVFISGMVLRRKSALSYSTSKFDGTLLYQLYLVACILSVESGVYIYRVLTYHRLGGIPDFGSSEVEKNSHTPKLQTVNSSINFVSGMLKIAYILDKEKNIRIYRRILTDIGNYSYPILSIHADLPLREFVNYLFLLMKLGFWRVPLFYIYAIFLLILGKTNCNLIILYLKNLLGRSPIIGNFYKGESLNKSND